VSKDAWSEGGLKTRAYGERLWAYCRGEEVEGN